MEHTVTVEELIAINQVLREIIIEINRKLRENAEVEKADLLHIRNWLESIVNDNL